MAAPSVARSDAIAAFVPALELLITEAMDEWKVPGLAVAVVQNGEVALVRAYGLRDVEAGLKVTAIGAKQPIPEEINHREVAVPVTVVNEMELLLSPEPRKAPKPRSRNMILIVDIIMPTE